MPSGPSRDKACTYISTRKVLRSRDEYEQVSTSVRVPFVLRSFTAYQLSVHMQLAECFAKHNRGVSEDLHEAVRLLSRRVQQVDIKQIGFLPAILRCPVPHITLSYAQALL